MKRLGRCYTVLASRLNIGTRGTENCQKSHHTMLARVPTYFSFKCKCFGVQVSTNSQSSVPAVRSNTDLNCDAKYSPQLTSSCQAEIANATKLLRCLTAEAMYHS